LLWFWLSSSLFFQFVFAHLWWCFPGWGGFTTIGLIGYSVCGGYSVTIGGGYSTGYGCSVTIWFGGGHYDGSNPNKHEICDGSLALS